MENSPTKEFGGMLLKFNPLSITGRRIDKHVRRLKFWSGGMLLKFNPLSIASSRFDNQFRRLKFMENSPVKGVVWDLV